MTGADTKTGSAPAGSARSTCAGYNAGDASLTAAVETALAARERVRTYGNARLVGALAATAREWLAADFAERAAVIDDLAPRAHLHPGMLAHGLRLALDAIDEVGLQALLAEAEAPQALERAVQRDGRMQRLGGPPVIFYSLAGNVPALSLPVIAASVLARSVAIVRDSERQRGLTRAFLTTLARHDADAAAMIVPAAWPSGDAAREREAVALAARVELYGSYATLRAMGERHRDAAAKTVERGTRVSVGIVAEDAAIAAAAAGFAEDVALYDGLGCLSPHVVFVIGPHTRARELARQLGIALEALEKRWPRVRRALETEAGRRAFIDACELSALSRGEESLLRGSGDTWVVHLGGAGNGHAVLGPGLRCVRVVACASRAAALELLRASAIPLAAVGLAVGRKARDHDELATALCELGATLVCAPGRMQAPPLTWAQDGRRRLGDLLAWQPAASAGVEAARPVRGDGDGGRT